MYRRRENSRQEKGMSVDIKEGGQYTGRRYVIRHEGGMTVNRKVGRQ